MKNKIGITKKLFILTSIVFAIFIGGSLIVQSLFFEQFYISRKKKELSANAEKFKYRYNKVQNKEDINDLIEEYEDTYNIGIIVVDKSNNFKLISKPSKHSYENIKIRQLSSFVTDWTANKNNLDYIKKNIRSISLVPGGGQGSPGNIIEVLSNEKNDEIIFCVTSLQPVSEAVSVIEGFYIYFCIGAVIFIILLSFAYSNMIAKPLIRINKVSKKMAKLDFSEKCVVTSQDEIGSVATSLNFLSENLNNALESLKNANQKLEKDIEKERELERMRKDFIAGVSHELKTPITLIDGYAVGLKDNIFEEKDKDYYIDIIIDEAKKMGNLVSDMLELSYTESGNLKLMQEYFNLTELISLILKKYETIIEEKQVKLEVNLLESVMVYADWGRMEQVITNFINNALRHVNKDGTISVNMIYEGEDVTTEIANTDSSIPEEELSKIWDKFYKIDKSRNRKLGGTGIGLAITKNILKLHGYSFGVKNTIKGVKFYFNVPKHID
ncbi:MAG: HAMP domain-containing sensor histidine kinase [Bacillota bacterium]|nr:HAMP domain-containing sensor histidine kinase [Bacillota bacterium]